MPRINIIRHLGKEVFGKGLSNVLGMIGDKLASRLGWQTRCKPTVLPSGRILLPRARKLIKPRYVLRGFGHYEERYRVGWDVLRASGPRAQEAAAALFSLFASKFGEK